MFFFIIYIDTNNSGLEVPDPYQVELLVQISLPQSPRQVIFWASAGFESTEESVTLLSDAPRRLALYNIIYNTYIISK